MSTQPLPEGDSEIDPDPVEGQWGSIIHEACRFPFVDLLELPSFPLPSGARETLPTPIPHSTMSIVRPLFRPFGASVFSRNYRVLF